MGGSDHSEHDEVLQAERAVNEIYRRTADEHRRKWLRTQANVSATTKTSLHKRGTGANPAATETLPLIGRVGLERTDPDLGRSFYIGHEHCELPGGDGTQVLSWAAPLARLFYAGPSEVPDSEVGPIVATRSFRTSSRDLIDFDDDTSDPVVSPRSVFSASPSETLVVPAAPRPVTRPNRRGESRKSESTPTSPTPRSKTADLPMVAESTRLPATPAKPASPASAKEDAPASAKEDAPQHPELRAERLVHAAIAAPRTGRLGSILSTLQENQYELVTWPADKPLVIQGFPGTGKTIVATHRAAYLVNRVHAEASKKVDGDPRLPLDRVALVGPTDVWATHVRSALDELDAVDRVTVIALDEMIQKLGGTAGATTPVATGERTDTTFELACFLATAVERILLRERLPSGRTIKNVTRLLLEDRDELCSELRASPELHAWLQQAESWKRVRSDSRYAQALAVIGCALGRGYEAHSFQHVVVDEAQDLSPMEWWLINNLHSFGGKMTLVGDLQQRRTDWSPMTWADVDDIVELTDGTEPLEVQRLDVAYRSTKQILHFASQLLPKGSSLPSVLQDGLEVEVAAVQDIRQSVVKLVEKNLAQSKGGLLAIITMQPGKATQALRKSDKRWRSQGGGKLHLEGRDVWILSPDQARGLEFDSVIIVEPADFPQNLGRAGPLYTSLTRATHELTVVHSKPLPKELRPPKRKR